MDILQAEKIYNDYAQLPFMNLLTEEKQTLLAAKAAIHNYENFRKAVNSHGFITLHEYANQVNPERGQKVYLKETDCHVIPLGDRVNVVFQLFSESFAYSTKPNDNSKRLYVMDDDGNPTKKSVFYLEPFTI